MTRKVEDSMRVDIDKLEALEKAATPGPWRYEDSQLLVADPDTIVGLHVFSCCNWDDEAMEAIVGIRNAFPELLSEVREKKSALDALAYAHGVKIAELSQAEARETALRRENEVLEHQAIGKHEIITEQASELTALREALASIEQYADSFLNTHLDHYSLREISKQARALSGEQEAGQ